jgi:hypothetical protein
VAPACIWRAMASRTCSTTSPTIRRDPLDRYLH